MEVNVKTEVATKEDLKALENRLTEKILSLREEIRSSREETLSLREEILKLRQDMIRWSIGVVIAVVITAVITLGVAILLR